MVLDVVPGWTIDLERGPDWLFVRLRPPDGIAHEVPLAETIWELMDQSFSRRIVLEMDNVRLLRSWVIAEIVKLHKRVCADGGLLRLCGMTDSNQEVLRISRLDDRFPQYGSRGDAVMGRRPLQPR